MPWSVGYYGFPRALRERVLREEPACRECGAPSTEADHIVGRAEALRRGWSLAELQSRENGQALCAACHAAKTHREAAEGRRRVSGRRPTEQHPGTGTG